MNRPEEQHIKPGGQPPPTIAQLLEKLRELPAHAGIRSFEIVWSDKSGYPNKIEWKK